MARVPVRYGYLALLILSSCAANVGVVTTNGLVCSSFGYGGYLVTAAHCPLDLPLIVRGEEKVTGDFAVYASAIPADRPECREPERGEEVRVVTMFGTFEAKVLASGDAAVVLDRDLGLGSSGSAIYGKDGAIVGMVTARFPGSWSLGVPATVLCPVLESLP